MFLLCVYGFSVDVGSGGLDVCAPLIQKCIYSEATVHMVVFLLGLDIDVSEGRRSIQAC